VRDELRLLATDRRRGKTTQAFAWVSNGVRTGGYPGWSRVLVLPNFKNWQYHRSEYWGRLEDFDHRVYDFPTWAAARGCHPDTEVCVEELQYALGDYSLNRLPGWVVAATMTAWPWEQQTFREPQLDPEWRRND
jgi:hypothetical protein